MSATRGKSLGLDDQAGAEAPAARLQRELSWLPQLQQLLEEARDRKLIELEKDEKSGGYIIRAMAG